MTGWTTIEAALDGVLARRWYTNHGPIARQLEAAVAQAWQATHAVAVTNPAIGLIMMAEAQQLSGTVLLSALAPPRCAQSLFWAGLRPLFCDIDPVTLALDPASTLGAMRASTSAILATPGGDPHLVEALAAELGLRSYSDGVPGRTGPALVEIACPGDAAGLACILTGDDHLAARLRNIRSSYGAGPPVPVSRTANGRVSEIQAAMALDALADAPPVQPGGAHRVLPWGGGMVLLTGDAIAALAAAWNWPARPVALHDAAQGCPVARGVAARSLLLPAAFLQTPAFADAFREAA